MSFDFDKLKKAADKKIKITPVLANLTVGKPAKTAFFRVRSGDGWEPIILPTYAPNGSGKDSMPYIVSNEDCQAYLYDLEALIPAKFYFYQVYGSGIYKLDYVSQKTDKTGSLNRYHTSRMEAYEAAKTQWVRMYANQEGGFYSWALAEDNLPAPVWAPKPENIEASIELAFKGFDLNTMEHPEIKKLKGKL